MGRALVILKLGSTYLDIAKDHGDFDQWVDTRVALPYESVQIIHVRRGEALPPAKDTVAAITTGAHDMVTDRPPWSERVGAWLKELTEKEVPVLGICYGHQLLAQAFGGEVGDNPKGREVGTVPVSVLPEGGRDILFGTLPDTFPAHVSHVQSVLELPRGAARLASTDKDPNHAFRIGKYSWGIQFHPEFSPDVMRLYIEKQRDVLAAEGQDPEELIKAVRKSPAAPMLHSFGRWAFYRLAAQILP